MARWKNKIFEYWTEVCHGRVKNFWFSLKKYSRSWGRFPRQTGDLNFFSGIWLARRNGDSKFSSRYVINLILVRIEPYFRHFWMTVLNELKINPWHQSGLQYIRSVKLININFLYFSTFWKFWCQGLKALFLLSSPFKSIQTF